MIVMMMMMMTAMTNDDGDDANDLIYKRASVEPPPLAQYVLITVMCPTDFVEPTDAQMISVMMALREAIP